MSKLKIGDKLIAAKIITEEQLIEGLAEQKKMREAGLSMEVTLIGLVLIKLEYVTKQQLLDNLF